APHLDGRSDGDHRPCRQGGEHADDGRQPEHQAVRVPGDDVLLDEGLNPVRDRLQQAPRTRAGWAQPQVEVPQHLALDEGHAGEEAQQRNDQDKAADQHQADGVHQPTSSSTRLRTRTRVQAAPASSRLTAAPGAPHVTCAVPGTTVAATPTGKVKASSPAAKVTVSPGSTPRATASAGWKSASALGCKSRKPGSKRPVPPPP